MQSVEQIVAALKEHNFDTTIEVVIGCMVEVSEQLYGGVVNAGSRKMSTKDPIIEFIGEIEIDLQLLAANHPEIKLYGFYVHEVVTFHPMIRYAKFVRTHNVH